MYPLGHGPLLFCKHIEDPPEKPLRLRYGHGYGCVRWVNHEKIQLVCCYGCCASQERINMSAVPTAPWLFFQLPRWHLAYPRFREQWDTARLTTQHLLSWHLLNNTWAGSPWWVLRGETRLHERVPSSWGPSARSERRGCQSLCVSPQPHSTHRQSSPPMHNRFSTLQKKKQQKSRKHHSVHHTAEITSWSRNLSFMGQWNIRVNHRLLEKVFLSRKLTRFLSWKAAPCCEYSVRRGVCSQTCHWFPHIPAPLTSHTM